MSEAGVPPTRATPEAPISYGARLAELADHRPGEVGVVFARKDGSEQAMTWAELEGAATRVARALAERGAGVGDRVALRLGNTPELVAGVLASWRLGAVPVPVRWDLPDWECERVLAVVDAAVDLADADRSWLTDLVDAPGRRDADRATGSVDGRGAPLPDAVSPQTHAICSSGSTGTPKVIVIERPALWDGTGPDPFPSGWGPIERPQTVLIPAPLYHTNGFLALPNVLAGDRLVILEKFDAARIVDLVERHRVTSITATPTMLQRIADVPGIDDRDLSSLVWVLQGAAAISPSLVQRWIDLVGPTRFFMAYGMTEGLGFTALRGDEWLDHPGSVGRGYRMTEIRILDDDLREVPTGEVGEIFLRWPGGVLYQYLGGASRLKVTEDGFASGGDLGSVDDDGYLFIADRRSDLIISGGANVFPAEVEAALGDHPDIADVVVIGLRDPEWGQRVHALVQPRDPANPPTEDDVRAFAKSRLAAYKVPKTVELVGSIPRSEATKVSRAALAAERDG